MTVGGAESYFSNRLWTDEWDNASDEEKSAAVNMAEDQVEALNFSSRFESEEYSKAVYEQALFLLKLEPGDRKKIKRQSIGVESASVGDASESYIINGTPYCQYVRQLIEKYKYQVGGLI